MAELPSGTVTFLFTDIEGSTRLLTELGEAYERVLTEHRQVLEAVFGQAGGQVVDVQGDAFFVAFRRAKDAAAAAAAAQRALREHPWPADGEPRVRMGIDTGEPSLIDEGFVGLPVHRAARICAAGHGGQILLSRTTRDLIEDFVPAGVRLIDLGEHRLKDLDRAEPISQLAVEGLPSSFPPLRTLESQPVDAAPFAGQEDNLAAAAQEALAAPPRHGLLWGQWKRAGHRRPLRWLSLSASRRRGSANTLESVGFRTYAMARIAPRDDLQAAVRGLGSAIVIAARLVGDADRLMRVTDGKALARRLAEYRESAHFSDSKLRAADTLAGTIAALEELAEARRRFDDEAKPLEPRLAELRDQLFEARLKPEAVDELIRAVQVLQQTVQQLSASLGDPYARASSAVKRPLVRGRGPSEPERGLGGDAGAPSEVLPPLRDPLKGVSPLFEHLRDRPGSGGHR
jgi:class 3 adenylate cyclase